jgi:hypothetical protein
MAIPPFKLTHMKCMGYARIAHLYFFYCRALEGVRVMDDKNPTAATLQAEPPFPTALAPRSKRRWLRSAFTLLFLLRGAAYGANWAFIGRR